MSYGLYAHVIASLCVGGAFYIPTSPLSGTSETTSTLSKVIGVQISLGWKCSSCSAMKTIGCEHPLEVNITGKADGQSS